MKTFFYILQKQIQTEKIIYPDFHKREFQEYADIYTHPFNVDKPTYIFVYNLIYGIYFLCTHADNKEIYVKHPIKSKYKILDNFLNNIFFTKENKENIFLLFSNVQKIYFAFTKVAYLYKYKKAKTVVTDDLSLNPICSTDKNVFVLFQGGAKYLFLLKDLINIIETAISNSPSFFIEILKPKNPYNNIEFNLSTLYNIYFQMKSSSFKVSTLFHLFFMCNFDKEIYALENEQTIRDFAIKKYVFTSPPNYLFNTILFMLKKNRYTRNLIIDKEFSKELLADIMKPFLHYYYISLYGLQHTEKANTYTNILNKKLKKFYQFNKSFGRRIIKTKRINNKIYTSIEFDTKHISFYSIHLTKEELREPDSLFVTGNHTTTNGRIRGRINSDNGRATNQHFYFYDDNEDEDEEGEEEDEPIEEEDEGEEYENEDAYDNENVYDNENIYDYEEEEEDTSLS